MPGEELGTLTFATEVDSAQALADLSALLAETRAVMNAIDGDEAVVTVRTNIKELEAAQKQYRELINLRERELRTGGRGGGPVADERRVKKLRKEIDLLTLAYKDVTATRKRATSALDRLTGATERQIKKEEQLRRVEAARKLEAEALSRQQWRVQQRTRDQELQVAKLTEKYAQLHNTLNRLSAGPDALKTDLTRARMERLRAEINMVRHELDLLGATRDSSMLAGTISKDSDRMQRMFSRLANGIGNVRLHMGFFSVSVRQMITALTVFGPIISGIAGSLIGLGGVLGTGLTAAAGAAGAALGGFGLILTGVALAARPMVKELTTAGKAAIKYEEQVMKTGKGSEEARDKLEEYHQTVKNLPPDTRKLIADTGGLYREWAKLTKELRKPFFNTAGEGIKSLKALMPTFTMETRRSFLVLSQEINRVFKGMGSAEGQNIFGTLMRQSRRAIPSIVQGLSSVAAAMARLSAASSRHLGRAGASFNEWAKGLERQTSRPGFQNTVNTMMNQMRSLSLMTAAAGRVLVTFFTTGASSGQRLVDLITATLNQWNRWMKSVDGQKTLQNFFEDSVTEVRLLYNAISPFLKLFARWTEATRPVSQAVLRIVAAFGNVLEILTRAQIVVDLFAAALLTFTGTRIIRGIVLITKAFGAIAPALAAARTSLLGFAAASKVADTAVTSSAAKMSIGTRATAAAGTAMGGLAGMLGRTAGFLAGPWGTAISAGIVLLTLFGGDLKNLVIGETLSFEERLKRIAAAQNTANAAIQDATPAIQSAKENYATLAANVRAYNKAVDAGKKPPVSIEALNTQADAVNRNQQAALRGLRTYISETKTATKEGRAAAMAALDAVQTMRYVGSGGKSGVTAVPFKGATKAVNELTRLIQSGTVPSIEKIRRGLAALQKSGAKNINGLGTVLNAYLAPAFTKIGAKVNLLRASLGKVALSPQLTQQVGSVLSQLPKAARADLSQAFSKMKPGQIQQISGLLARLQRAGKTGAAIKLASKVDEKGADASIRSIKNKLRQLKLPPTPVRLQLMGEKNFNAKLRNLISGGKNTKNVKLALPNLGKIKGDIDSWVRQEERKKIRIEPSLTRQSLDVSINVNPKQARAEGGMVASTGERAGSTRGGRYAKATFLVGEENRPEFVIATNPSYRRENIGYLQQAAAALNVSLVPAFGKGGRPKKKNPPKNLAPAGAHDVPFPSVRPKQVGGRYNWLKQFIIPWSETETDRTRAIQDDRLARGLITVLPYDTLIADIDRTLDYYTQLENLAGKRREQGSRLKRHKGRKNKDKNKRQRGRAMFADALTTLYNEIPQARNSLEAAKAELLLERDGFGAGGQTPAQGAVALSAERYNLMQQFGSNVVGTGALGGMSFARAAGTPSLAGFTSPAAAATAGSSVGSTTSVRGYTAGGGMGAPAAGKTVSITNNYQEPPPDPHTWSKQVEWEASVL